MSSEQAVLKIQQVFCLAGHQIPPDAVLLPFINEAIDAVRKERDEAYDQLRYLWNATGSCPCGARRESPTTHPHVGGCPTAKALKQ